MEWSVVIKILVIALGVSVLWRMHANKNRTEFDLADLFVDRGKVSARKFYEAGAFFLTSLWFASEIVRDQADLTDMLTFAGLWAAVRTVGQINHLRNESKDERAGS